MRIVSRGQYGNSGFLARLAITRLQKHFNAPQPRNVISRMLDHLLKLRLDTQLADLACGVRRYAHGNSGDSAHTIPPGGPLLRSPAQMLLCSVPEAAKPGGAELAGRRIGSTARPAC